MAKYNISFSGQILPGQQLPDVKRRFAKAFRIHDLNRVDAFFTGVDIILRRNLERQDAKNIQRDLLRLGIVSELLEIEEPPETPLPATTAADATTDAASAPRAKAPKKPEQRQRIKQASEARAAWPPVREADRIEKAERATTSAADIAAGGKPLQNGEPSPEAAVKLHAEKSTGEKTAESPAARALASDIESATETGTKRNSRGQENSASPAAAAPPRARRRKQPGAPNFFDLRLSEQAGQEHQREEIDAHLRQAPLLAAAIMALAFVLVGLRFWAENFESPAYGLGSIAINPLEEPAVVVNDALILHERSGLDIERIPLRDLGVEGTAEIRFFSSGELLLLEQPRHSNAPPWLQSVMGIDSQDYGRLLRCNLATRSCALLRDELEQATILVEPRSDNILLADIGRNRLEKLSPTGERLAVKAMALVAPIGLAHRDGLLYLTRGDLNSVSVLKPDTENFAAELDVIGLSPDGKNRQGLIFPTALEYLQKQWWVVLQSRDARMAGLFRFDENWRALARVDLPGGAEPTALAPWAGKLLAPDAENEMVYRIAADGEVEAPFNEEALGEALATRRGEIARTGMLQVLVMLLLFLGAACLFVLGTVQSLQTRLYRPSSDIDEAEFDINDENIEWLDPAGDVEARLRRIGYAIAGTSAVLLVGAFLAEFSAPALLAIILVLVGLGGYYLALQRASGCHLGLLDDQLILVDHNNTYRVGRGSKIQYLNNFVMIDDVIVFLGTRLLPQFAGEQLHRQFEPVVIRGIRVDRTTLRLKLINGRHPLLFGTGGLIACGVCALALLLLA